MYDESEGESSDEDLTTSLMKKCLDVELPANFDPNIVPNTGTEYVQLCMWEAKQIKYPVYVKDYNADDNPQSCCQVEVMSRADCPNSMIPSIEWQNKKVEDFKKFQKYMSIKVPDEGISNRGFYKPALLTETPTLDLIVNMVDNRLKYLEYISEKLEGILPGESISYNIGLWLYNLMGTYNLRLNSDEAYVFRDICRKLANIRKDLKEDASEELYKPLNLLICIIARCFGQYDLADE